MAAELQHIGVKSQESKSEYLLHNKPPVGLPQDAKRVHGSFCHQRHAEVDKETHFLIFRKIGCIKFNLTLIMMFILRNPWSSVRSSYQHTRKSLPRAELCTVGIALRKAPINSTNALSSIDETKPAQGTV